MGVLFVWVNEAGDEETWDPAIPSTEGATNNEMELEAPIEALEMIQRGRVPVDLTRFNKVVIRTDSLYVHDNVANAKWTWRKTGWIKKSGASVLHSRTWKRLISEMRSTYDRHHLMVHFEWVPGKKGRHATAVDKLAKRSANSGSFGRFKPNIVTRKTSSGEVEPGSVKAEGQTFAIRIIQAQYIPPPRRGSRYKYEVVEELHPSRGQIDWAESDLHLQRGLVYVVRMNDAQENPRFEELVREIEEDLSPYEDVLARAGTPLTVLYVAKEISSSMGKQVSATSARVRLDRLVESGKAHRVRGTTKGHPYLYERVVNTPD
jgi:ribonuclease HI